MSNTEFWTKFAGDTISTIGTGLSPLAGPLSPVVSVAASLVGGLISRLGRLGQASPEESARITAEMYAAMETATETLKPWVAERAAADLAFGEALKKIAKDISDK